MATAFDSIFGFGVNQNPSTAPTFQMPGAPSMPAGWGWGGPSTQPSAVPSFANKNYGTGASPAISPVVSATPNVGAQDTLGAALSTTNAGKVDASGAAINGAAGAAKPGELAMNVDTLRLGLGGLQTLGSLWAAYQANDLAKKQFAYQKNVSEQNLANSMMSYNTTLEDRIRSRTAAEAGQQGGMTQQDGAAYLDSHRLQRRA